MENQTNKNKSYYIKRTKKLTGEIVHIGPSDLLTINNKLKEYQSIENDEYEYCLLEFVYTPMVDSQ